MFLVMGTQLQVLLLCWLQHFGIWKYCDILNETLGNSSSSFGWLTCGLLWSRWLTDVLSWSLIHKLGQVLWKCTAFAVPLKTWPDVSQWHLWSHSGVSGVWKTWKVLLLVQASAPCPPSSSSFPCSWWSSERGDSSTFSSFPSACVQANYPLHEMLGTRRVLDLGVFQIWNIGIDFTSWVLMYCSKSFGFGSI